MLAVAQDREERVRFAFASGATGATDSVDVFLDALRKVVVDDELHADDVQAATGNVGADHDRRSRGAKFFEDPVALFLFFVAVQAERGPTLRTESTRQLVHERLGLDEDQDRAPVHLFF